jgi:hypothetical protein
MIVSSVPTLDATFLAWRSSPEYRRLGLLASSRASNTP